MASAKARRRAHTADMLARPDTDAERVRWLAENGVYLTYAGAAYWPSEPARDECERMLAEWHDARREWAQRSYEARLASDSTARAHAERQLVRLGRLMPPTYSRGAREAWRDYAIGANRNRTCRDVLADLLRAHAKRERVRLVADGTITRPVN